jgi:LacI family gluconate utilization system Gnt-I transcriptional repressor
MQELLSRWPDTEAVMCVSDLSAFGALSACLRSGVRVPEDIAIGGFGAYDVAEMSVPAITTIDVQASEIGRLAADIVLQVLADPESQDEPIIRQVTPELIVRQTT